VAADAGEDNDDDGDDEFTPSSHVFRNISGQTFTVLHQLQPVSAL